MLFVYILYSSVSCICGRKLSAIFGFKSDLSDKDKRICCYIVSGVFVFGNDSFFDECSDLRQEKKICSFFPDIFCGYGDKCVFSCPARFF